MVITSGLFIVNKLGQLLIAHPTGHSFNSWSIPKGGLDLDESELDGAIRETFEETNLDLRGITLKNFIELPYKEYSNKKKKLKPFIIFEKELEIDLFNIEFKCNTFIDNNSKYHGLPEMNGWMFVDLERAKKLLHPTQVEVVKIIEIVLKNG